MDTITYMQFAITNMQSVCILHSQDILHTPFVCILDTQDILHTPVYVFNDHIAYKRIQIMAPVLWA